jgi:uncharacterized membrane protein
VLKAIRLGFGGVMVVALGHMAATGRLPRNIFAGIRIPSTMRSDEAWRAGHRAAASALTTAGFGPVVVAVIVAAKSPGSKAQTVLSRIATGWLLGWIGLATLRASRVARASVIV